MSEAMGAQSATDLLALLRQCEATDEGVMVERRTGELGFDSHTARENISTSLTLDYADKVIDDITPNDDDLLTGNVWTVTRSGGASATVEQTDGPMGTDPTTGAGRYEKSATLSLYEDSQAYHHAGWRVWLGTVNGYRYPRVALKLHNSNLTTLRDTIAAVDISDRITITNLPSNLPPDDVELIVEGYTEIINSFEWTITFNCAPYSPYAVGVLAEPSGDTSPLLGRLTWDSCELDTGVDDNDTSWLVNATPLDTTSSEDHPRDVFIGGERVTVTACSGASSPQTWTVTRSVNGTQKSHSAGAVITLAQPLVLTL